VRGTRVTGWRRVLLFGVVGCLGLGAVLVVAGGGVLWWAGSTAAELGDPTPAPTTMTVALEPVTLSKGAAEAGPESRLIIDLSDGEFDVIAGEPGSDVQIDGVLATNYYELVEERDGVGRDGPVTAIRLRPTAGTLVRMMAAWRRGGPSSEANRLTVSIPPDRPLSLVLHVSQGQSRIDLGGLTLTDLSAELSMGDHRLGFGTPVAAPLPRLEVTGNMGNIELNRLGNARAEVVRASTRMGNFEVDLSGAWPAARVSEVVIEHSMGDLRLRVPTSLRIAETSRVSARMAEPSQIARDGETTDPTAAVVRLDLTTTMGGTHVSRFSAPLTRELEAQAPARSIPSPVR
jgi:hypothetical protein